jgi:hypothetical protein
MTDETEHRWDQGDRGQNDDQHRHGPGDSNAVYKIQTHQQHTQHGNQHGHSREHNRLTGSTKCTYGCVVWAEIVGEFFAIASDDEQHVVNAHAKPNHARKLCNEVRHGNECRDELYEPNGDSNPKQCRENGQAHGDERTKGQQQNKHRGNQSEDFRRWKLKFEKRLPAKFRCHTGFSDVASQWEQFLWILLKINAVNEFNVGNSRDAVPRNSGLGRFER